MDRKGGIVVSPMKRALLTAVAAAWLLVALWPREASPHNPITTTVLFNREVSKILAAKCLSCHRDGSLAMPLGTYNDARPWAVAIKEEVLARQMPPWPAARGFGEFSNDAGLTTRELEFLISWIDGGVPEGTGEAAAFIDHGSHWMMGEPGALLAAAPGVTIEPSSGIGFKRITIDTGFGTDRWVRAIDYKPGAAGKRVARAAFLSVAGTGQYLGAWTPWSTTTQWPEGVAVRVPARSGIVVDVLYQSGESAVVDAPSVGLYFAEQRVPRPVSDIVLTGTDSARQQLPADSMLLAIRGETTPPGASIEVSAKRPDGSSEVLPVGAEVQRRLGDAVCLQAAADVPEGFDAARQCSHGNARRTGDAVQDPDQFRAPRTASSSDHTVKVSGTVVIRPLRRNCVQER